MKTCKRELRPERRKQKCLGVEELHLKLFSERYGYKPQILLSDI